MASLLKKLVELNEHMKENGIKPVLYVGQLQWTNEHRINIV